MRELNEDFQTDCTGNAIKHRLFQRQLDLEREMEENGERRVRNLLAAAREKKQEANTLYGSILLKQGIESLTAGIEQFMTEAKNGKAGRKHIASKLLQEFPDIETVAFLALKQTLNGITQKQSLSRLSLSIADTLGREAKLIKFKTDNSELYSLMTSIVKSKNEHHRYAAMSVAMSRNEIGFEKWSLNERTQLGLKIIDLIITYTGYIEIMPLSNGYKTVNYVVATDKCTGWITRCKHSELLSPEYLPTIIPPKEWTNPFDGGYYSKIKPLWLVKARFSPKNYLEELNNRVDKMPIVYEAVNAIQNTAYRINNSVYEVMAALWDMGGGRAGLVNRENNLLPNCPICGERFMEFSTTRKHPCFSNDDNFEMFKGWKHEAELVYSENIKIFSKKLQLSKILYLATKFKGEPAIYFPHQLDFRGRVYPVPNFLQPQGSDWAKGLLEFAEGKPLNNMEAVRWLAIHGANLYGEDKVSLDDRFMWVLGNEGNIKASAADPYSFKWWQDADKPFQFLAFCFEWSGYVAACESGCVFQSHIVVGMDGTCNGLQIFSLLLRDEEGGRATNLIPHDTPQDIYAIVADKVKDKLALKMTTGGKRFKKDSGDELYDEKILASFLLDLGINRKTTKRQVMTLPYGATFTSCKDYTCEWLMGEKGAREGHELFRLYPKTFHIAMFLAELIWEAINETVTVAHGAMEYLQGVAGAVTKEKLPVTWTTPVGLNILQAYKETRSREVKSLLSGKVIRTICNEETPKLDISRQKLGISPNFIHSLDAAAMMKTVSLARKAGVSSFSMVHDSYGVHACHAVKLANSLRRAFVELFEDDILQIFSNEVTKVLPPDEERLLPPLPKKGLLQISDVLKSEYFFA